MLCVDVCCAVSVVPVIFSCMLFALCCPLGWWVLFAPCCVRVSVVGRVALVLHMCVCVVCAVCTALCDVCVCMSAVCHVCVSAACCVCVYAVCCEVSAV